MAKKNPAPEVLTDEPGLDAVADTAAELDPAQGEIDELPEEYQGEGDPRIWLRRRHAESEPDAAAVETAAVDMVRETRAATQMVTNEELGGISRVGKLVGMAQYAEVMENANRVARLKMLLHLKESGEYKNLPMENTKGELVRPKNFEELCVAVGTSRAKVEEDARNLSTFGERLLEGQKSLGIGYRELRALRSGMAALPEGEQKSVKALIEEAVSSGDKEEIYATLEEIGARNKKLHKELSETQKTLKSARDLQKKTRDKLDDLETRLGQALNPSSEDERQKNLADARAALREQLDGECNALVGLVSTLCNHVGNVRKADTERDSDPVIDAATWEHINARMVLAFDSMRGLVLAAGMDVYAPEYADADYGPHTGEPEQPSQQ